MGEPIIVEPTSDHLASVIWLHGLGASADDFYSLLPALTIPHQSSIRWIFPNAPHQPVSINGGMRMPSWFDITGNDILTSYNLDDVSNSSQSIRAMLQKEYEHLQSTQLEPQLYLAGFSQGGLIALDVALHWSQSKLKVLALSCCYSPLDSYPKCDFQNLSVVMMHGQMDTVIPYEASRLSYEKIATLGVPIQWRAYSMGHEVSLKQIEDINAFFSSPF